MSNEDSLLNTLSKSALQAAMRGGVEGWGQDGDEDSHVRYAELLPTRSRKRCRCGCARRATHFGMANGVALRSGCQLSIMRWEKS